MWFKQVVANKKALLADRLTQPMGELAAECAPNWGDADELDEVLAGRIGTVPYSHLLYALDTGGTQISANVFRDHIDIGSRQQVLADRPYTGNLPYRGFLLSSVYESNITHTHCITALQAVTIDGTLRGFVAADFNLEEIPLLDTPPETKTQWTQYKGDPAIRGTVFQHKRMGSILDQRIDAVVDTLDTLMRRHGVYHIILHFSSSRAIFWVYDDPYRYRFHSVDEILDPEIWLLYPAQPYPKGAVVAPTQIRQVLERFKALREDDENIYLRSGSLNLMNGIIGLTFSCDGSHYIGVDDFLDRKHAFWG